MAPFAWRPYLPILVFLCHTAAHLHASEVIPDGTNGHAFCSYPLSFQRIPGGSISSFSTTFVVTIGFRRYKGHGLAFMLSSTNDISDNSAGQFLGLPSSSSDDHVFFAVELDTVLNPEFKDIDNNHVGINVDSLLSVESHTAGFYDSSGDFKSVELRSGKPVQVWVDYDSKSYRLNVTLALYSMPKPELPLLSTPLNLSSLLSLSSLYAGFSAASDKFTSDHYVLGWSFKLDGEAQPLDYSQLPLGLVKDLKHHSRFQYSGEMTILGAPTIIPAVVLIALAVLICRYLRNRKEDKEFEIMCGPPSFTYKELFTATDGFNDKLLLGKGGFGRVYEGVLSNSAQSIAIKRVSPESKQGKREFMAEIAILGRVRHRNLVQLLGYCRYKKELLLVYDCMPNGSLDKYLYNKGKPVLDWAQRLSIIKGVASGLCYLHEDWERVIIHRDIKASNVLLDNSMKGRLSDFGLARFHDHGVDAHTTRVAGTWGYIAPELARLGKATKATDVFAFGIFMIEVVCGRQPIGMAVDGGEPFVLADWVLSMWKSGSVTGAVDPKLEDYDQEDAELVLKLGLLCSHSLPKLRPCMRLVMLYLERGARLNEFCPASLSVDPDEDKEIDHVLCSSGASTITVLSGGR
ncbi:hypothetical protein GQ55_3G412300 [Panicum hallii var. hallii]|uniref:non-specific serine/threonine protein kinase n=1 Tax=Panicum hallii var. hallii TaxID=1504633 RepID=A0A2T7EH68_9POAL|nr:hypothetical protein GQ55_3G412300 [Panicum hallii var. hallii]